MTDFHMKATVLHVIDTTGPGGAETVFLDLAEECSRQGFRSIALIRGPGWVEDQLKARGITYYIRDCKGSLNIRFLYQVAKIVRQERVAQIQSHLLGSNVYMSLLGILFRIPVVATFHGHVDISERERFRNAKLAIIGAGATHVVCVTEDLKETVIRSAGWARLKPLVIPNGVNTSQLETLPIESLAAAREPIVFGCLGNVRPAKNYKLAVDFMAYLKQQNVNAKLLIAGHNKRPETRELQAHLETLGLGEQISFLGFVDDVPAFFSSIDVFLMTSSSEGHPLALTQALAAGKPVVSTRSGVEKVIPESLMFLAEEHTVESLSSAHVRLVKTEQLASLLDQGREFVRNHYSLDAMFTRYLSLYKV